MDAAVVRTTLSLIGPSIFIVFGIGFASAWLVERKRNYLLLIAGACVLFAMGSASQILHLPADIGLNAMVSGALYTAAVLAIVEGILLRSSRRLGLLTNVTILAMFCGLLWYFFYIDRNLVARIYIQNFGYGVVLLLAAGRLSRLRRGRLGDRILFWSLLAFGTHFFPRTILTIGFSGPVGPAAFGNSVFWQALQLSLAVLGSAFALAILSAAVADVIDDLRRERDIDHLTGIPNRRGFDGAAATAMWQSAGATNSLILCDIDHFKSINDDHGHDVGDRVLHEIAKILKRTARKRDVVGRIGGEEFAIFLPDTNCAEAYECAERLRIAVSEEDLSHLTGRAGITASFGIATGGRWEHLYKTADDRLYDAKRDGRNRTVASSAPNSRALTKPFERPCGFVTSQSSS